MQTELFCDLNAIPSAERDVHTERVERLFAAVLERQELTDGYALRLPADTGTLLEAAAFIANERLCCPFFGFVLELAPGGEALWLRITGPEGVKELLRAGPGMNPLLGGLRPTALRAG